MIKRKQHIREMKYEDLFNFEGSENNDWWNSNAYYNKAKKKDTNEKPVSADVLDLWRAKFKTASDDVNSPSHYTHGRYEAIEVIEDSICDAPDVKAGFLLGQVLKYLLRLWHKKNAKQDAEKARWYLNRLIEYLT